MRKVFSGILVPFLLSYLLLSVFSGNAFANTTSRLSNARFDSRAATNTANNCLHQLVLLSGSQPPKVSCLDQPGNKSVHPGIRTVNCSQSLVELSIPSDGDTVCISGDGFLNLSTIFLQCTVTHYWSCGTAWAGLAQNYDLYGCATYAGRVGNSDYPGYFASDYNGNGTRMYFKSISNSGAFSFPGRGVLVGPDSLLINC